MKGAVLNAPRLVQAGVFSICMHLSNHQASIHLNSRFLLQNLVPHGCGLVKVAACICTVTAVISKQLPWLLGSLCSRAFTQSAREGADAAAHSSSPVVDAAGPDAQHTA